MASFNETITEIERIRTETAKNANSSERVGSTMRLIADRIMKNNETITLLASNWIGNTYSYSLPGLKADNAVIVSADTSSDVNADLYYSANIRGTTNETNIINFKCDRVPASNVRVNIMIF